MLQCSRTIPDPTRHLTTKPAQNSVHSPLNRRLIVSQLKSQIRDLGRHRPDASLDPINLKGMASMHQLAAILAFIFARNSLFQVADVFSKLVDLSCDVCCMILEVSGGLIQFAVAFLEDEIEGVRSTTIWVHIDCVWYRVYIDCVWLGIAGSWLFSGMVF